MRTLGVVKELRELGFRHRRSVMWDAKRFEVLGPIAAFLLVGWFSAQSTTLLMAKQWLPEDRSQGHFAEAASGVQRLAESVDGSGSTMRALIEAASGRGGLPIALVSPRRNEIVMREGGERDRFKLRFLRFSRDWGLLGVLLVGAMVGFRRWRIARESDGMQRYFTERRQINDLLLEVPSPWRRLVSDAIPEVDDEDQFRAQMFVYAELDQLEYCHSMYGLRLLEPHIARRACRVMISRCKNDEFRALVLEQVERGRYDEDFTAAVIKISQRALDEDAPRQGAALEQLDSKERSEDAAPKSS